MGYGSGLLLFWNGVDALNFFRTINNDYYETGWLFKAVCFECYVSGVSYGYD
jgi:hypothetical protein